jgi:hypothetical protein
VLSSEVVDSKAVLVGSRSATVASVYTGRLLTLGIYCTRWALKSGIEWYPPRSGYRCGAGDRYAVKLWLRPDVYVVFAEPLNRIELNTSMVATLRELPASLSRSGE